MTTRTMIDERCENRFGQHVNPGCSSVGPYTHLLTVYYTTTTAQPISTAPEQTTLKLCERCAVNIARDANNHGYRSVRTKRGTS